MPFRSPHSLLRRTATAGAASALALTLFNAAQPSLGTRQVQPGTVQDVAVSFAPAAPAAPAPSAAASRAGIAAAPPAARTPAAGPATLSAPVQVGKARFVGFSWPAPTRPGADPEAAGKVWLRARTAAGWSGWREVEPAADGPDATSPEYRPGRVFSDGQWLDAGTSELQLRVDPPAPTGPPGRATAPGAAGAMAAPEARAGAIAASQAGPASGLRAHLVAPDMTPTPGTEPPRAGVATAATAQPRIISRAAWGANESIRRARPDYSRTVKAAFVHHTVQGNRYSPSESAALVRAAYLYHVRSRGWNDIGYNFLVDRYGRVFEGRYGGVTRAVLGAHAGGFNTETTGVAMIGNFSSATPPRATLTAVERLLAWKLDLTHVDPRGRTVLTSRGGANTRYPAGRRVRFATILGHRHTSFTTCPGSPTLARLAAIRTAVSRIGRPKIYGGSVSSALVDPERRGSVVVSARFSNRVRWRVGITGSHGGLLRTFSGVGTRAAVRWNGRTSAGTLAPPGYATLTISAASARPASRRVFVARTAPVSATSTGGFSRGLWSVSNVNAEQRSRSSRAFTSFRWGAAGDIPIFGDWDGDGTQTPGIVRRIPGAGTNHWALRNSNGSRIDFRYGSHLDHPVVGDWDGNGTWTPGVVRNGQWRLRNTNAAGPPDLSFVFGQAGDRFLVGDWDGDGDFTPGIRRSATFWLRNQNTTGTANQSVTFGRPTDVGFAGDWNGDNLWTPAVLRSNARWFLKNSLSGTAASAGLAKQTPGTPVVGNWDNRP